MSSRHHFVIVWLLPSSPRVAHPRHAQHILVVVVVHVGGGCDQGNGEDIGDATIFAGDVLDDRAQLAVDCLRGSAALEGAGACGYRLRGGEHEGVAHDRVKEHKHSGGHPPLLPGQEDLHEACVSCPSRLSGALAGLSM